MGMRYVDNGPIQAQSNVYFTREENDKCVEILREWRPRRLQAIQDGDLSKAPIPEYVGERILKICTKISHRYNYSDHTYREDMVNDAVLNLMKYLHGFDPEKIGERSQRINFFSWVTRCADRTFGSTILSEKRQDYYKYALFCQNDGFAAVSDDPDAMDGVEFNSDMAYDFITRAREYEDKERERALKGKLTDEFECDFTQNVKPSGVLRFLKKD